MIVFFTEEHLNESVRRTLMKKEDFNQLFDDVRNGVIAKKEALGMLGKFIQDNYPMFGLHRFDEDFRAELLVSFLEKGEKLFDNYNPQKANFFKFFFYYIMGLISSTRRYMVRNSIKETLIFEENVISYSATEKNYSIQNTFKSKMLYSSKKNSNEIKPYDFDQLKDFFSKFFSKSSDKKIIVLALKSCFYLTEVQIKKVCELYHLDEKIMYDTIQYCKMSVISKSLKVQKALERRNYNYFHHKKCEKRITELTESKDRVESKIIKDRLIKLDGIHYNHWQNLNRKFSDGFIYLRPTNKTIGDLLNISVRQVSYYIKCARLESKELTNDSSED